MKRLGREPQKLETLNLFSLLQSGASGALYDPSKRQSFLAQVDSGLTRALDSEATLHGIRVQTMFRGMVANLDFVQLLKEEDAGDCYSQSDDEILVPDFRVVTEICSKNVNGLKAGRFEPKITGSFAKGHESEIEKWPVTRLS